MSSQGALKNLEKERSKLSEEISRLKIVEEELLLKCNMLESTDPELAVALKNARDENHKMQTQVPEMVPPLNLELLGQDYDS